jgi:transposase-like protein
MYARGLSTRDIEDAFLGPDGELLLSRTAVSEITDRLWEDYQAFCARDLSQIAVEYLFVDAVVRHEAPLEPGGDERAPPPGCRSSPMKLGAA